MNDVIQLQQIYSDNFNGPFSTVDTPFFELFGYTTLFTHIHSSSSSPNQSSGALSFHHGKGRNVFKFPMQGKKTTAQATQIELGQG